MYGLFFPQPLVVTYVHSHVARRSFLSLACPIVVVQANELVLLSLGRAVGWQVLQQLLESCGTFELPFCPLWPGRTFGLTFG